MRKYQQIDVYIYQCEYRYEPWHVISNNVAFWQEQIRKSQCSLLLSLETPNDVPSVA